MLFEFQRVGNILRVTAIDPKTATEVIMIADPRHSKDMIQRLAARKLAYVISKKATKTNPRKTKQNNGFSKLL